MFRFHDNNAARKRARVLLFMTMTRSGELRPSVTVALPEWKLKRKEEGARLHDAGSRSIIFCSLFWNNRKERENTPSFSTMCISNQNPFKPVVSSRNVYRVKHPEAIILKRPVYTT